MNGRVNKVLWAGLLPALMLGAPARGERFLLLTGRDAGRYPGADRFVSPLPGPGIDGQFNDGQRLAGSIVNPPAVSWQGVGVPLLTPNQYGSLSFYFKRGSVPLFGQQVPFIGIDFLGGPLMDLDGNPAAPRSLVPVSGQTPVAIPNSASYVDLTPNTGAGTIALTGFDATGTDEGGPGVSAGAAVTLNLLADGALNGGAAGAINPAFDTRLGTLTPFTGGGGLSGVWRIDQLRVELWYDSIDPNSGSATLLGTFQHFSRFRGWLVRKTGGSWPTLAGQGLGTTLWPTIDSVDVGQVFNRAFDLGFGPTATIFDGNAADTYSASGQLGEPLTAYAGDLGGYFDAVVVPLLPADAASFVYLESAGFGINNTGDPVFGDTNGYDLVVVAASRSTAIAGDVDGDGDVDGADATALAAALTHPGGLSAEQIQRADVNGDGALNGKDVQAFVAVLP